MIRGEDGIAQMNAAARIEAEVYCGQRVCMTKRGKTTMIVAAVLAIGLTLLVWEVMTEFSATVNIFEGLSVSAPTTRLRVGESTQLTIQRKLQITRPGETEVALQACNHAEG